MNELNIKASKRGVSKVKNLVVTKKGTFNKFYDKAFYKSRFVYGKRRIYTCEWSSGGGYYTLYDSKRYFISLLNSAGYKWSLGNDSRNGGASGNYIQLYSNKAMHFIHLLRRL